MHTLISGWVKPVRQWGMLSRQSTRKWCDETVCDGVCFSLVALTLRWYCHTFQICCKPGNPYDGYFCDWDLTSTFYTCNKSHAIKKKNLYIMHFSKCNIPNMPDIKQSKFKAVVNSSEHFILQCKILFLQLRFGHKVVPSLLFVFRIWFVSCCTPSAVVSDHKTSRKSMKDLRLCSFSQHRCREHL